MAIDWDHAREVCEAAGPETAWLYERLYEHHVLIARQDAQLATLRQDITEIEVILDGYEALQEAHAALMLEHEDLQAAYYVAQRALAHAQKGDA